jgi:aldose 1-epimerase
MKRQTLLLAFALVALLLLAVNAAAQTKVTKDTFGQTPDGQSVDIYTLTNSRGAEARITNYGGIVVSLKVPDRDGKFEDVVLGLNTLDEYLKGHPYFGAIIGRYGNRIAKGQFKLNGTEYKLAVNNGENHLHGGIKGFDKVVWDAKPSSNKAGATLTLSYLSKDGEEGYPGNLKITVAYILTNNNELKIVYSASTDKDTVVNLTHHSYFNLSGEGNGDILGHQLQLNAAKFTPTDAGSIPTGELLTVRGTPFDFTKSTAIGLRINQDDQQIKFGNGYDHNFVVNGRMGVLRLAAKVWEPRTGRTMEVWTTEPGVQFYTGNFLDGTLTGKRGKAYQKRTGFCLETQHYPDAPNKPTFPSTTLRRGARLSTTTIYRFGAR